MLRSSEWSARNLEMRLLIIAKTYPVPQEDPTKVETVCTGALGEDNKFYRLYPVPFRLLEPEEQYSKWEWIEADLSINPRDPRPESRIPKNLRSTDRKEGDNVKRARLLLPSLKSSYREMEDHKKKGFSICLVRLLNPTLGWVENKNRARHKEVARAHEDQLFPPEWIETFKRLEHPPRLLVVNWHDQEEMNHQHTLFEWEYYKVWTDYRQRGKTEEEADTYVYERSLKERFNTKDRQVWGLFGTHRAWGSWVLGGIYNFSESNILAASTPLFPDTLSDPFH